MKRKIKWMMASMVCCVVITGCSPSLTTSEPVKTVDGASFHIFKIGECQYVSNNTEEWSRSFAFTHKGDCNNPAHVSNKLKQ